MKPRRLIWRLYPIYLALILASIFGVTWYMSGAIRELYVQRTSEDLRARAMLISEQVNRTLLEHPAWIDSLCDALGGATATRITVILRDGVVVADTHEDPARMENHSGRPEFLQAFNGHIGSSIRFSTTVDQHMMYVAAPLYTEDRAHAAVRTALPLTEIDNALVDIQLKITLWAVGAGALAGLIGLWVSQRLTRPLEELRRGADRFARGELTGKIRTGGSLEIEELAEAMNHMAERLDHQIAEALGERNEREAILSSMVEGVLAVDNDDVILSLNQTAARWFEVDSRKAVGRAVQEVIRNTDLQRFLERALQSPRQVEGEIGLRNATERILQAVGSPLRDADNRLIGVVVALHDVTQVNRLERMRRDFVANVSHELKTPITSITGFVETLQRQPDLSGEERVRFLDIIARQAERLNDIIDDLLTLSRIEHDEESSGAPLEATRVKPVIQAAVQLCRRQADEKGVTIDVQSPLDASALADARLLEQALTNLIDNAVKYSDPNSRVEVTCRLDGAEVSIGVRDFGCGIEAKHLPRLFERFYRADKARSRKLGGTGLGLSIVKHIAQLYGGRIEVESEPGRGSLFTIVLRKA
ncbi:MAG TPA: ATP-binding protein [candidate division Zixibacteria bacterium]|nr:ATP-binding protein [candidate division Zixibacteria bacterium]